MTGPKSIEIIRQRLQRAPLPEAIEEVPLADAPCGSSDDASDTEAPTKLANLFAQRQATRNAAFRPIPQSGQILRVGAAERDSESPNPVDEPLAVLLDAPIAEGKWRGWLVGRDPEYATAWDLILGPEEDPRDPQCEVVQIWNPVTVTLAEADRVLAELSDERLSAARMLSQDHAQQRLPTPIQDSRMGVHLARELSDGTGVVTGTPVAAGGDPRREYQEIYRGVGIWVSQGPHIATAAEPARGQIPEADPLPWIKRLFFWSETHWWKPATAFAALAIVPLLLFQIINPSSVGPQNRYIAGGDIQELRVARPEIKARELENRLRAVQATPEIRHEAGGTISVQADLKSVAATDRAKLLIDFGLKLPGDGMLRVLIVAESAVPQSSGPGKANP